VTPNLLQIREALTGSHVLDPDEVALPIWDNGDPYGIGVDSESRFILVLRACGSMGDISGSHFSFSANVNINVRGIGLYANVSVLKVSSRPSDEVDIEAIAAVFLGLIEVSRDRSVSLSRVIACFETLFETGKSGQTSRETLIGLIGELIVISISKDKDFVLSCWSSGERDRFDFSCNGERVEVKATTAAERIHHFNSKQIPGPLGSQVLIASVKVCEVEIGQRLIDLIEMIKADLASEISKARLIEKTMLVLRGSIESQSSFIFDISTSALSVVYYSADSIPRPTMKSGVLSMEWTALLPVAVPIEPSGPLTSSVLQMAMGAP
jgi:hypothetical protein